MSGKTYDDMFDVISMNEVDPEEKEIANTTAPPVNKNSIFPARQASLLECALDEIEKADANDADPDFTLTFKELTNPKPDTAPKKLKAKNYTTRMYVFVLNENTGPDGVDVGCIKYEEIVNSCLSGDMILAKEEWYDLKNKPAIKVVLKVLIPNEPRKKQREVN